MSMDPEEASWDNADVEIFEILKLPEEMTRQVLVHLSLSDLMRFARVNRYCRHLVRSEPLWRDLLRVDFKVLEPWAISSWKNGSSFSMSERLYAYLVFMEFTADLTSRDIDRVGFTRLKLIGGTRFFNDISHWVLMYPPPQNLEDPTESYNALLEFELPYGVPPLGMEFIIWWASEEESFVSVLINSESLSGACRPPTERFRLSPPSLPLNPRRPLTEKPTVMCLDKSILRQGLNNIRLVYHPDSRKRCFIRKVEMMPGMKNTVRRATSKRRTITIVRSNV